MRPVVLAAVRCDGRVRPVGRHPAGPGTQAGGQQAARTAAGGGAAGGCQGTVNKTFGCVLAGCQVTVQTLDCPIGAAPAGAPAGAGAAPPAPAVLAALATGRTRPHSAALGRTRPPDPIGYRTLA